MCFNDYITIDRSTPSRSGLYASDLPGVSISLLEQLTDDEQADYLELWEKIYTRSIEGLISDFTDKMLDKFHVDLKLVTRETSQFKDDVNSGSQKAGIYFRYELPKYAKLHIISVQVFSEEAYSSPEALIQIYEKDENGELLYSKSAELEAGRNTIDIDQDFEVDEIFVAYDPAVYSFRKTENKYFNSNRFYTYDKLACTFPCVGNEYQGYVRQVNGGGVNVKFVVQCSIRKFICENINIFKNALWWKIGVELMIERIMTDTLSRFTTLTKENADAKLAYYNGEYDKKITSVNNGLRIPEDDMCFVCKSPLTTVTFLP